MSIIVRMAKIKVGNYHFIELFIRYGENVIVDLLLILVRVDTDFSKNLLYEDVIYDFIVRMVFRVKEINVVKMLVGKNIVVKNVFMKIKV